eukprot:CAMPEP_0171479216 /NCGR_PEP_ID=MMETSP0946-20130122/5270_1 /TAXON_ID=109269 /ORGANISM="Vaucheria litorea, Strain CCMP2940" /LENGTH=344 /DNA_ID=CAMNT_0012010059 /DNA_START=132 /DNA_END=1163 /DNA_ORIENTATION=-
MESWCTIESDPGVFTELIEAMGVKGVQVEELYSFEKESFERLENAFGLIFLFKWTKENDTRATEDASLLPDLYFPQQVIQNACATQALLSVLLNSEEKLELGEILLELKRFTHDFTPDMKGLTISNSQKVREVHNSFASQDPFYIEKMEKKGEGEGDAFHFIAYVPHNDTVYELDGLKKGPIDLGRIYNQTISQSRNWTNIVLPAILQRIENFGPAEFRFNLMAVVRNKCEVLQEKIDELMKESERLKEEVAKGDSSLEMGTKQAENAALIEECRQEMKAEEKRYFQWKKENARRKHNYIPFTMALLRVLAREGKIEGLIEKAKERVESAKKRTASSAGLPKRE